MNRHIESNAGQHEREGHVHTPDAFASSLSQLFFPDELTTVSPLHHWSDTVRLIQTPDKEYIGKRIVETPYALHVLHTTKKWFDSISLDINIFAPEFIAAKNGLHFPTMQDSQHSYLCVMPKVDTKPYKITSMEAYTKMGTAIALLHKKAPEHIHSQIHVFDFAKTNQSVEQYWELLTREEKELFSKILRKSSDIGDLPSQLTHNDIHPENLLSHNEAAFFLDFDQMLIGPRINDVGQALSSFWLQESEENFHEAALALVEGYNRISQLTPQEVNALPLFALRKACISFAWFKGIYYEGNGDALAWYQLIRQRAYIIHDYITKHSAF